ncbi:MAG: class I SAM-dependent methyltransferase [Pseudomonadota bacterium]
MAKIRRRVVGLAPKNPAAVEIGVHRGDFAAEILTVAEPETLHLIDPWRVFEAPKYERSLYGSRIAQSEMDARHDAVVARFSPQIAAGQVKILRKMSQEAAQSFAPLSLDFIYLDGDHSFEGVSADIAAYWPKLRPGGILAGDDYQRGGWWQGGVIDAFRHLLAQPDAEVALKDASQIAVRKL